MIHITRLRIMEILKNHRGIANSITRTELSLKLQHYAIYLGDRKIREAYSGLPICSCEYGLFRPVTTAEVEEYRRYLTPKMSPALVSMKIRMIYATYPELLPAYGEQMTLELGRAVRL